MQSTKYKNRVIITLQLKNAEVYPGSNLHGTVILQLVNKRKHDRHRSNSVDSNELTPRTPSITPTPSIQFNSHHQPPISPLVVVEMASLSFHGICQLGSAVDQSHFPLHLKNKGERFNILRGKGTVLGKKLQLRLNQNESIQFDFAVQLPHILPCSYRGFYVKYRYYAQLAVIVSKGDRRTKCDVGFSVLPNNSNHDKIPKMLTPINLTQRTCIVGKRSQETLSMPVVKNESVTPMGVTPMETETPSNVSSPSNNSSYKPSPSLLNFTQSNNSKQEEKNGSLRIGSSILSPNSNEYYLRRASLSLNYRDRSNSDEFDELHLTKGHNKRNTDKYRISLDDKCIGVLLLNDTVFCEGDCIEGYLSLYIPCIVRVTLVHTEKCGKMEPYVSNCTTKKGVCWYIPSFTFSLKVTSGSSPSFESDLCSATWSLNFEFAISKKVMFDQQKRDKGNDELGYLNSSFDIWDLHNANNKKKKSKNDIQTNEVDKILKWQLPIIVTTVRNPLRCVTRSNAVVIKC